MNLDTFLSIGSFISYHGVQHIVISGQPFACFHIKFELVGVVIYIT